MNKNDLINTVAGATNQTKKVTTEIINATFEAIGDALVAGEKVSIFNFGAFSTKDTAPRVCKNPQTGEDISVPASKKVSFKVSDVLRSAVKGE